MKHTSAAVIHLATANMSCDTCPSKAVCAATELSGHDPALRNRIVRRARARKKSEVLYRLGDPLQALYVIRAGSIRTSMSTCEGEVQVLGFHVPGELLGIDAISENFHPSDAVAIETSVVCELPFPALEKLMHETPVVQRQFLRLMSREIAREEELMCMLGQQNADSRLAACLLSLSARYHRVDTRGDGLTLSMSREDLGNHLGLAMETVSRLFTRFQEEGLLSVTGRHVQLLDYPRLRALQESGSGGVRMSG